MYNQTHAQLLWALRVSRGREKKREKSNDHTIEKICRYNNSLHVSNISLNTFMGQNVARLNFYLYLSVLVCAVLSPSFTQNQFLAEIEAHNGSIEISIFAFDHHPKHHCASFSHSTTSAMILWMNTSQAFYFYLFNTVESQNQDKKNYCWTLKGQ